MNIKKIASAASALLAASLLLSGCSAVSNGDNDAAEEIGRASCRERV